MQNHPSLSGYKGLSGFHKYWGKKPTETWRFLIKNFTNENEIVLDPFLGSGLIAKECADLNRRFIGFDVNPISIELTKLYLELPGYSEVKSVLDGLAANIKDPINSMYTLLNGCTVSHLLWEKDKITNAWIKERNKRIAVELLDDELKKFQMTGSYYPRNIRPIRLFDNSRINSKQSYSFADLFTPRALRAIDLLKGEIEQGHGNMRRALLLTLSSSLGQMSKMVFAVTKRGKTKGEAISKIEVGSWVIGYWRPDQRFEINAWNCFENKARKLLKAIKALDERYKNVQIAEDLDVFLQRNCASYIAVGDSEYLLDGIPSNSVKVILTDPPHGDRIPYLELSEMWNSVIGLDSNYENELVVSNAAKRGKTVEAYNRKLSVIFEKCDKVLNHDGLMAIIFNARSKNHWRSLDDLEKSTSLKYIGSYPMEYSANSVVQDNRKGGLKTDYVLLYGKKLKNIAPLFKDLDGWSESYPKK